MDGFSYRTFIELLEKQPRQAFIPDEEVECVKHGILGVLKRYGIEGDKVDTIISPSVITIEIIPQQGYKVFKIRKYIDDIGREIISLILFQINQGMNFLHLSMIMIQTLFLSKLAR